MSFLPLLFGTVQTIEGALENFLSFLSAVIKAIIRSYVGCEGWNFLCKITVSKVVWDPRKGSGSIG